MRIQEGLPVVLVGVLDGGDEEDECEWEDGGGPTEDRQLGQLVEDGYDEEVDVGDAVELLEQVPGEEGQDGVLAGSDGVARQLRLVVRPVRLVDVDEAGVLVAYLSL